MFFKNKKGITPIIAVILLLIMTVSAAGTAFYWLSLIQNQLKAEEQLNIKKYGELEGQVEIVASRYDEDVDSLILFLRNIGGSNIPIETDPEIPTTLWILKDQNENVICSTDWSGTNGGPICKEGCNKVINSGEIRRVVLSNFGQNALCDITTQPPNSLIHYTIDFSGKAVITGGFVRWN